MNHVELVCDAEHAFAWYNNQSHQNPDFTHPESPELPGKNRNGHPEKFPEFFLTVKRSGITSPS